MRIITVSVTVSLIKIQLLMIVKKGVFNRIRERKKDSPIGINIFGKGPVLGGYVGARQTNNF